MRDDALSRVNYTQPQVRASRLPLQRSDQLIDLIVERLQLGLLSYEFSPVSCKARTAAVNDEPATFTATPIPSLENAFSVEH